MRRVQKKKVTRDLLAWLRVTKRSREGVRETIIDSWLFLKICLSQLLLT